MYSDAYIRGFMDTVKTAGAMPLILEKAAAYFKALKAFDGGQFRAFGEFMKSRPAMDQIMVNDMMARFRDAADLGVLSMAKKVFKRARKKGMKFAPGRPILTSEQLRKARRGAEAAVLRENRGLYPNVRRVFDAAKERGIFDPRASTGDILGGHPWIESQVPLARAS